MVDYDSDSSGADEADYTETNVLLGYASKEPLDDVISHLGGRPSWLEPSSPPSAALARCIACKDLMVLLLQLNGDLPENFPGHERRLYVLTCRRKTCRRKEGSVRVLRSVRVTEAAANDRRQENSRTEDRKPLPGQGKTVSNTSLGDTLFGAKPGMGLGSANPFSTLTSSKTTNPFSQPSSNATKPFASAEPPPKPSSPTNLPKTFAAALSLNASAPMHGPAPPPEPWPPESAQPAAYPLLYLADADFETLDKDPPAAAIPSSTMDFDEPAGSSTNQKEDKEVFESNLDSTFQKFADRLAQNSEQVIRYEFKGQPLLYSKDDAVGKLLSGGHGGGHAGKGKVVVVSGESGSRIPRCANCAAQRVFEVQLTPHAITELEAEDEGAGLDGMDWGTIIVGVCERDCTPKDVAAGQVGYVEEWAGVQWEDVGGGGRG